MRYECCYAGMHLLTSLYTMQAARLRLRPYYLNLKDPKAGYHWWTIYRSALNSIGEHEPALIIVNSRPARGEQVRRSREGVFGWRCNAYAFT